MMQVAQQNVQTRSTSPVKVAFYHGGDEAVRTVKNAQGVDGEIISASVSPNVARRYGDAVSCFSLAEHANVRIMTLQEWFMPRPGCNTDTLLTDHLRMQGVDAVIVLGDDQSYDYPVPTLFVLDAGAVRFETQMTKTQLDILDDGRSYVMDPRGPGTRGWDLYMKNFTEDICRHAEDPDEPADSPSPGM